MFSIHKEELARRKFIGLTSAAIAAAAVGGAGCARGSGLTSPQPGKATPAHAGVLEPDERQQRPGASSRRRWIWHCPIHVR